MKTFRLLAAGLFMAALFSVTASAQTAQPATASTRIAVINTQAFGAKEGITKYSSAIASIQREFDPVNVELRAMGTRYENLRKEIENLREQMSKANSPISYATVQAKIDEYDKLGREIKFKQEDAKARSQSRYNVVMSPVLLDINKAIQDYAKQKGYTLIFNAAKLEETGLILGIGDEKVDVTRDFITFYNTRPAGTASSNSVK